MRAPRTPSHFAFFQVFNTPLVIVFGRLASAACALTTAPPIARALGPDGRGYSAAMLAILAITPVLLGLGIPLAVRRRAAVGQRIANLIRTARLYSYLTLFAMLPIALALAISIFAGLTRETQLVFIASMCLTPLTICWMTDVSILVIRKSYRRIAALNAGQTLTFTASIWLLWLYNALTLASVSAAYALGGGVMFILGHAWVRSPRGRVSGFWSLMKEGAKLAGSQAAEVASQRLDQILVLPIIGASGAGIYSVAVTIASLPMSVTQALNVAVFASIAADRSPDRVVTIRAVKSSWVLGVFASLPLALVTPVLIPVLFSPAFSEATPVAFVSILGSLAVVVGYTASMALAAGARGLQMTIAQAAGLAVAITALWPLGSTFGAIGAAIASTVGYSFTLAAALLFLRIPMRSTFPSYRDVRPAIQLMTTVS